MGLTTTTIGAYPKPDYVQIPDWFRAPAGPDTHDPTQGWSEAVSELGEEAEAVFARGVGEVVGEQVAAGIDIPTDGEVRRENYIHYHCRHLNGIDFAHLTEKEVRGGTYSALLPTIIGPISAGAPFLVRDWQLAQSFTDKSVKMTMPGPMTLSDTTVDRHYGDERRLGIDVAGALNCEVLALAEAGCRHIQIDEPVFARRPQDALAYGFENLERAFHGCPDGVTRTVHMCCGYPDRLDHPDYAKAPPDSYAKIAQAIEDSTIQAISFEDAHRHNDLALLETFKSTTVILGLVAIAKSHVESVEEIRARLAQALEHIDGARLIAAPDCGLGILGHDLALAKLRNLCEAARGIG